MGCSSAAGFLMICMSVSANAAWLWIVANQNGRDVNAFDFSLTADRARKDRAWRLQ